MRKSAWIAGGIFFGLLLLLILTMRSCGTVSSSPGIQGAGLGAFLLGMIFLLFAAFRDQPDVRWWCLRIGAFFLVLFLLSSLWRIGQSIWVSGFGMPTAFGLFPILALVFLALAIWRGGFFTWVIFAFLLVVAAGVDPKTGQSPILSPVRQAIASLVPDTPTFDSMRTYLGSNLEIAQRKADRKAEENKMGWIQKDTPFYRVDGKPEGTVASSTMQVRYMGEIVLDPKTAKKLYEVMLRDKAGKHVDGPIRYVSPPDFSEELAKDAGDYHIKEGTPYFTEVGAPTGNKAEKALNVQVLERKPMQVGSNLVKILLPDKKNDRLVANESNIDPERVVYIAEEPDLIRGAVPAEKKDSPVQTATKAGGTGDQKPAPSQAVATTPAQVKPPARATGQEIILQVNGPQIEMSALDPGYLYDVSIKVPEKSPYARSIFQLDVFYRDTKMPNIPPIAPNGNGRLWGVVKEQKIVFLRPIPSADHPITLVAKRGEKWPKEEEKK